MKRLPTEQELNKIKGRSKFEDAEDFGWLWFSKFGDLCPECAREWKLMVRDFIGEEKAKTIAPVWRLEEE